jgi:hypothetical protein
LNAEARQIFRESGLTYNDMFDNLPILEAEISRELGLLAESGGMVMGLAGKRDHRFVKGTRNIECFFLFVAGPYFKKRECISFNADGFIGFAGWASSENSEPIIKGFLAAISKIKVESI